MDVDAAKISPEEQEKRRANQECFYCGKKGHFAKDCRKKQYDRRNEGKARNIEAGSGETSGETQRGRESSDGDPLKGMSTEDIAKIVMKLPDNDRTTVADNLVNLLAQKDFQ